MPRRIEVELTSTRPDGSWTWRAAGAREPKGDLDGALVYGGAKVGDVVRADADFALDGISILAVLPPRQARQEPERLEIIGPPQRDERPVTTALVRGPGSERRDRGERGERGDRKGAGRDRAGRGPSDQGAGRDRAGRGPSDQGAGRGERQGQRRPDGDRSDRPRRGAGERHAPSDRTAPPRDGEAPARPGVETERETAGRDAGRPAAPARARRPVHRPPPAPARPKPKRLRPRRVHRSAVIDGLPPEQRPIAEQVLQGGVRAVVAAVDKQNETARAASLPEVKPDALVHLAEQMLPRLRSAEWRDRAEAAIADVEVLDLRDLRSVVVAAETGARDDEGRELAAALRAALARRVDEEHAAWLEDLTTSLADGRVVRALRLSSRPPKAGALLGAEVAGALAGAASAALGADVSTDRWATVLDAVAFSPIRRLVKPASVPDVPSDELKALVQRFAARLPAVAGAFGIEAPSAPARPPRSRVPGGPGRRPPSRPTRPSSPKSRPPSNTITLSDPPPAPPPDASQAAVDDRPPTPTDPAATPTDTPVVATSADATPPIDPAAADATPDPAAADG